MSATALFSDEQLMQQMASGEERALELLFKKYYAALVRFSKDIVKDWSIAEDVVQEVFTKIWDKREQITITSQVKSYLYVSVKNHSLNHLRLHERTEWMNDSLEDDYRVAAPEAGVKMDQLTLEQQISKAIDALPPKCALIFKMSRFEEKSYREIAEALELSVKTVENQMGKALATLRVTLAPYTKGFLHVFGLIGLKIRLY